MRYRLLILGLMATLLTGCSLDDERDECCEIRIHFNYFETGQDMFKPEIHSMRHFLFDIDGMFVGEIPSNENSRDLVLTGLYGHYTLITIANATSRTWLGDLTTHVSNIRDFMLEVNNINCTRSDEDTYYGNTDELCYGIISFAVGNGTDTDLNCELSNIHCHLHVYAFWKHFPPYSGEYTLRVFDVPSTYNLGETYELYNLSFPTTTNALVSHAKDEYPVNFELEFDVISLRYTGEYIPIIQLYNGETAVTGLVDLKKAFRWWGWHPDTTPVQDYWIKMEIDDEGTVRLNRWGKGKVLDWINGGVITG